MNTISPKYAMTLINSINETIWELYKSYENVLYYIKKWQDSDEELYMITGSFPVNFCISYKDNDSTKIDLCATLHRIDEETLLKIAIDLGIDTPDFIPSIPTFRNEIKSDYSTASATFEKACKNIEKDPSIAIGLANSALESIIKEILKDERLTTKWNTGDTLYKLSTSILKEFNLYPDAKIPEEIKTIGSSLLSACKAIERIRSTKTNFHGKTGEDYIVDNPMYAYFIVNSISSVGLFLMSFYKMKYLKDEKNKEIPFDLADPPF